MRNRGKRDEEPVVHHLCKSRAMASFGILVGSLCCCSPLFGRMNVFFLLIMENVEMACSQLK